jgi:hypothetical protein
MATKLGTRARRSLLAGIGLAGLLGTLQSSPCTAQVQTYHIGRGGLSWASQAEEQNGTVDVGGALQPLELSRGQNLVQLLRASGQVWQNGSPSNFLQSGQPRAWSNDGPFNQISGPLSLVDGDAQTSSQGAFKTSRSQAGATFFWDLGAPYPIERVRFYPDPDDPDSFIKAFELLVSDGTEFDAANRPLYRLLQRVETNRDQIVDLEFASFQGRFFQLKVLSKSIFNLAEFEIFGQGFVPSSSYISQLHSFGRAVNFGRLRLHATRLSRGADDSGSPPVAAVQLRSGVDHTPLAYFRRDRDTGVQEEIAVSEYNSLPRRALFRLDPVTRAVLGEVSREEYLTLPLAEVGPVRDFVQGDVRDDVENWSAWTAPLRLDSSGTAVLPLDLPSPREFLQFRIAFSGEGARTMRIDTVQVEFSPALVSSAVGEAALETDLQPASGRLAVVGGVDTAFVLDIRAEFAEAGLAGFRGVRLTAFPPPVFERLEMGDPLTAVPDVEVATAADGFDIFFAPVNRQNNQPIRLVFKTKVLEHNTPLNAWLLGDVDVPPHPIVAGDASAAVGTASTQVFALEAQPTVAARLSTPIITPDGNGTNEAAEVNTVLAQFATAIDVEVEIFALSGRRVRVLVAAQRPSGAYTDVWDGRDEQGELVAPGLYLCRITIAADAETIHRAIPIGVAY